MATYALASGRHVYQHRARRRPWPAGRWGQSLRRRRDLRAMAMMSRARITHVRRIRPGRMAGTRHLRQVRGVQTPEPTPPQKSQREASMSQIERSAS